MYYNIIILNKYYNNITNILYYIIKYIRFRLTSAPNMSRELK